MHLCFATPWRTSWKPLCCVFLYARNTHLTFNALLLMIFCLCYFYVITWLLSFILKIISFMPMFRVLWSQHSMLYIVWSRLCWCMSPQKLLFCYHLPSRGRAGVKLGDAWYVWNVSIILMLHACFTPIALCFVYTLWRFYAFSRTNLLTRCHSASSLFSAVFVFQKSYTWNILGIAWNEAQSFYFPPTWDGVQRRVRGGQGATTPGGCTGGPLGAAP
jgi:hypothetical protein